MIEFSDEQHSNLFIGVSLTLPAFFVFHVSYQELLYSLQSLENSRADFK